MLTNIFQKSIFIVIPILLRELLPKMCNEAHLFFLFNVFMTHPTSKINGWRLPKIVGNLFYSQNVYVKALDMRGPGDSPQTERYRHAA